jgi:type IV pilus assembly protein PilQ
MINTAFKRFSRITTDWVTSSRKTKAGGRLVQRLLVAIFCLSATGAMAQAPDNTESNELTNIGVASLPGDRVQLTLTMAHAAPNPVTFTIENPARIALDFPNTRVQLAKRTRVIGIGMARSVNAVEANGRTRVVINMAQLVPYETRVSGNNVYVTLESGAAAASPTASGQASTPTGAAESEHTIENIDFRRGENGQGRVVVTLSDPSTSVAMSEEGSKVVVDFLDTKLPSKLERRLDVADFATPVKTVDTVSQRNSVRMVISNAGDYESLAYQTDNIYTIEIKPITRQEKEAEQKKKFGYTGERLSLNFQNIEVRAVLQLLADFTGLNIVVSDSVQGSITLRLKNVPWDQAMDIILKTKGLAMRRTGNVILVAPSEEIAAREKLELESKKQIEELAPLRTEWFQINYAKATDLAALLKSEKNSLLSPRGSITIDERTNTLMIQDTGAKLDDIRKLITRLDIPVRQVLIESRIVIANSDFSKDLGVRFGGTAVRNNDNKGVITGSGSAEANNAIVNDAATNIQNTGQPFPVGIPDLNNRLIVDLPASANAARLAFAVLSSNYLLDLELSAMQAEGRGEIISSPRVITSNQKEATIEQGVEIPYQEATSSGATSVQFKKAVLSLKVTPQITPDDRVIMDLAISKDNPDFTRAVLGVPPVNTRNVSTQVLINNGETVVLGGVYEQTKEHQSNRVPFFGDMPWLGVLFRDKHNTDNKSELLIFVTPKIVKESMRLQQ